MTVSVSAPESNMAYADEIAIIGMVCRYPRTASLEALWQLLSSGEVALGPLPAGRFGPSSSYREPRLEDLQGNFVQDAEMFDHRFFNVSGREAKFMDPQQRLALQVAYEALESSNYFGRPISRRAVDVGCYVGVGSSDYAENVASCDATAFSATGTLRAFISGRISHFFGWSGPSMTFDTACSSSAVAIHTACKALLGGECALALAGGVNVMTSPLLFQNFAAASFLSLHESSRAFDASATGYSRGEGAGILVLKRLSAAVADGDAIVGVIAGSAVNQNHRTRCITVPDSPSQSSLYRKALSAARMDAGDVSYVEAHGTGTRVGDPVEYESLRLGLCNPPRDRELYVGSVKDNIGHSEAASGVASVIKVLLMMHHGEMPKQASFSALASSIASAPADRITILRATQPWTARRRVAMVTNCGAAGSNVCLMVREHEGARARGPAVERDGPPYAVVLAAKSEASLRLYMAELSRFLGRHDVALRDVAQQLAWRQDVSFAHRAAWAAKDKSELMRMLQQARASPGTAALAVTPGLPVVLVFGGQTGQQAAVSKEVYDGYPVLRHHLDKCHDLCRSVGLPGIVPAIFQREPVQDLVQLHCLLLALQVSSAASWLDSGLEVDTLVGHSFGQLSALCVAGSLSLHDAFLLVSRRAALLRDAWGPDKGAILGVEASKAQLDTLLSGVESASGVRPDVACYNGPAHYVLSGSTACIDEADKLCRSLGIDAERLADSHAFHSTLAESILGDLRALTKTLDSRRPRIRVETCSPGATWAAFDGEAIASQFRQPVYFVDAVERISSRLSSAIWLEAGSSTPVIPMVRRILHRPNDHDVTVAMELAGDDAMQGLAHGACRLWSSGASCSSWLASRVDLACSRMLHLPPYQFDQASHWIHIKPPGGSSQATELVSLVTGQADSPECRFAVDTSHASFDKAIKAHRVRGEGLCQASLYFELAIRCVKVLTGITSSTSDALPQVEGFTMLVPLTFETHLDVFVRLRESSSGKYHFGIHSSVSSVKGQGQAVKQHAAGWVSLVGLRAIVDDGRWRMLKYFAKETRYHGVTGDLASKSFSGDLVYELFSPVVDYAPAYRGIQRAAARGNEAAAFVTLPRDSRPVGIDELPAYDAIVMDNFLQVAGIHVNCLAPPVDNAIWVCTAVSEISLGSSLKPAKDGRSRSYTVYTSYDTVDSLRVTSDVFVHDAVSRELVAAILGITFRALAARSLTEAEAKVHTTRPEMRQHKDSTSQMGLGVFAERSCVASCYRGPSFEQIHVAKPASRSPASSDQQPLSKMTSDASMVLIQLRQLLSNIIDMPFADIRPNSLLEDDLNIDSLLITEVSAEIHATFQIDLELARLSECLDVISLGKCISSALGIGNESPARKQSSGRWQVVNGHQTRDDVASCPSVPPHQDESTIARAGTQSFSLLRSSYDMHTAATGLVGFYQGCFPLQSRLVLSYVVDAFAKLGCELRSLASGDEVPLIRYEARYEKLIPRLYRIVEEAGLVYYLDCGRIRRTVVPVSSTSVQSLQHEMLTTYPQHGSETKLLHATASRLADCLGGLVDPLSLLFKDSTARSLLEDVYTNAPMFKTATLFLGQYICHLVSQLGSVGHNISILEIGGGLGGTTKHLVEALSSCGIDFSYTFSDLSSSLVAAARRKFSHLSRMAYRVIDIEENPDAELQGSFDIVISTNCIHATRDLVHSTTNIRKLLRPGGLVCLVEATRELFWFDLVFGLVDCWWLFDDGREHALAKEDWWGRCLKEAGFQHVQWTDGRSRESDLVRVIIAAMQSPA